MRPFVILALLLFVSGAFGQTVPPERWYKGNTHTHTSNSDGDSVPYEVAKWYRENGYNFVFITDHEYITDVAPLNQLLGKENSFLVISAQEVTDRVNNRPYHINGLGLTAVVRPNGLPDPVATLQKNIDDVRTAGAVPQLNHPNFGWVLSADDIRRLKNVKLMEIYNGHPLVNNLGGGGYASVEQIWDDLLTGGYRIYGVADDDSHVFKRPGDKTAPLPGQGWVMVRASDLSRQAVMSALDRGDFYASTGVELEDYSADDTGISIDIREARSSKYRVEFIGKGGRVLAETSADPAVYKFKGDEGYVRAKIHESNGKLAWTQPVMIRNRPGSN